jgi:hypothetical protein
MNECDNGGGDERENTGLCDTTDGNSNCYAQTGLPRRSGATRKADAKHLDGQQLGVTGD